MVNINTDIVIGIRITKAFPNSLVAFEKFAESLVKTTKNYRPIVIDDDSDPEYKDGIGKFVSSFDSALLLRTFKQHWFTKTYNLGLNLVRTPYCVILNSDTILREGWLEELFEVKAETEQHGKTALVGSVHLPAEQRRYEICRHPGYVTGHCVLLDMIAMWEAAANRGTPGRVLDETSPATIHIRSDVELSYRLMSVGWQCVKSFKSHVEHEAGKTWGHLLGTLPRTLDAVAYKYY